MQNELYRLSAYSFWTWTMALILWLCINVAVQAQESWVMVGNSKVSEETASFLEKGEKLSAKQDFEGAVAEFRQAVRLSPQVPELHINLASVLNLTGKYAEAVSECKKAIETNPNDAQAWSITGYAYQSLGRVEEALFAYKRYLQLSSPKDPARRQYVNAVQGLESELKFRKTLPSSNLNNYLSEVTWDGVHCWASSKMPLKVFLADGRGVAGFRPEFNQIMRNSFAEWAKASNGKIAFVFVLNKKDCDISCAWSNDRSTFVEYDEAGQCKQVTCSDGVLHADIVIACCTQGTGIVITDEGMHNTCLHEIGHAIGLHGHSPQAEDIMFSSDSPSRTTTATITKRDAATIQALCELKFSESKQK